MYFKKIILALSLIFSLHVCAVLGESLADLTKLSEVELIQRLIQKELTDLKGSKIGTDNLSLDDTEKLFTQACDLCNELKKDLSVLFKVWSKIRRNPIFENTLFENIEMLRKQLLQYKLSQGTIGNGIPKEKLIGLVSLLKMYKSEKQRIADNVKGSFLNKSGSYMKKFLGIIFWPVYKISEFYTVKIVTEIAMFLAIAGLINGAYFSESFLAGFTEPFITTIHGIWNFIFHSDMPISCDGRGGMDFLTCKTVEWIGKLV